MRPEAAGRVFRVIISATDSLQPSSFPLAHRQDMSLLKVIGGLLLSAAIGACTGAVLLIIGAGECCQCVRVNYSAVIWGAIIAASYYSVAIGRILWRSRKAARLSDSGTG
jgi:hypothetical protein